MFNGKKAGGNCICPDGEKGILNKFTFKKRCKRDKIYIDRQIYFVYTMFKRISDVYTKMHKNKNKTRE